MLNNNIKEFNFGITNFNDVWHSNWNARLSNDPVKDLKIDLKRLRGKSRDLHGTGILNGAIQNATAAIIGRGLYCNPLLKMSDKVILSKVKESIKSFWEDWATACHINGQTDLPSLLRAIVAAIMRDGDVLVYLTSDEFGDLKLDLISSDRISTPPKEQIPKGKDVYLGVQVNKRFIEGYWIENSVDKKGYTFLPAFDELGRIKSVLLSNPNNTDRINSYRGLPIVSSVIDLVEDLDKFNKSELMANVIKTKQLGVIKTDVVSDMASAMVGVDPMSEATSNIQATKMMGVDFLILAKNTEMEMTKGQEISNPGLASVNKNYREYIANVFNMPYNIVFNIMEDASYSAIQTMKMSGWEAGEIWRNYLVHNLLKPIYQLKLEAAILNGDIEGLEEYSKSIARVEFTGKANFQLKSKDIFDAQAVAVKTGQKSIVQVCNENGLDAYSILDERLDYIAAFKAKMQERGLTQEDVLLLEDSIKATISNKLDSSTNGNIEGDK